MGFPKTPVDDTNRGKVENELQDIGNDLNNIGKTSDTYQELVQGLISLSDERGYQKRLSDNPKEEESRHTGQTLYIRCCNLLEHVDEVAGTEHYGALERMVDDLWEQALLEAVSCVALLFFSTDEDGFLFKYMQSFLWEIPYLLEDMERAADPEDTGVHELVKIGRQWGRLCETGISPVVTLVHYLINEMEIDLDRAKGQTLRNNIEFVQEFSHLNYLATCLDADHRNSLNHGGKQGDCVPDRINREVNMWYRRSDGGTREVVFDESEFREIVVRALSAVAVLFLLPVYLISAYSSIAIDEFEESTTEIEA